MPVTLVKNINIKTLVVRRRNPSPRRKSITMQLPKLPYPLSATIGTINGDFINISSIFFFKNKTLSREKHQIILSSEKAARKMLMKLNMGLFSQAL